MSINTNITPTIALSQSSASNNQSDDPYAYLIPDITNLFQLQPELLKSIKIQKAQDVIVQHIRLIPNFSSLRINLNLVKRIMDIIENLAFTSKSADKKKLLIDSLNEVFQLSPSEMNIVSDFIQYVHSNGQIIKLSKSKIVFKKLKKLLTTVLIL